MHKLLATAAVLAALAAPAFASSGHIVTHYKLNAPNLPNSIIFVMDDDGGMDVNGAFTGVVYCAALTDPASSQLPGMFDQSKLFGYDLSSGLPINPIYFNTGTPGTPAAGTTGALHPAECGSNTYTYSFRK